MAQTPGNLFQSGKLLLRYPPPFRVPKFSQMSKEIAGNPCLHIVPLGVCLFKHCPTGGFVFFQFQWPPFPGKTSMSLVARAIRNAIRANRFAIEAPVFIARQADSPKSLESRH